MGELIVSEDGKLDLGSVATLSKNELRDWIDARLHGQDHSVPEDVRQGEPHHYLIASIYPELDRDSRRYIRDIVRDFLFNMSRDEASPWQGEAAHALLMLAQNVNEPDFIAPIREMAEDGPHFSEEVVDASQDLHRRLLQSLVMLDWRGTREFWLEQLGRAPDRYAGVVFAGLAKIALQHAINLLPDFPFDNEDVQRQMRVALRGLLPAHDHSAIGQAITEVMPRLSRQTQERINGYLPEISTLICFVPQSNIDLDPARRFFRDRGFPDHSFDTQTLEWGRAAQV